MNKTKVIGGIGKIGSTNQFHLQDRIYDGDTSVAITTAFNPFYKVSGGKNLMDKKLKIRKLTPRTCLRLMGVKDEDIELISEHLTKRELYHIAGDSIVTTCIMSIMAQFYDIDYTEKVKPKEWWKNEN